jgi:putative hydrolase of the HAD superfamily
MIADSNQLFDVVAFDADDTLWHNETLFTMNREKFRALLVPYLGSAWNGKGLHETEMRNLRYYGYGIKSFTLSMIETAIELTGGQIKGSDIQQIIDLAKSMVDTPVKLLDQVAEVIPALAGSHTLMLITKGDLFDQESKIAQSGLAQHFKAIEIVSDKTVGTYQALCARYQLDPRRFLMVGNSLRSDILPVVALGARAVYIPYHLTWEHELVADHDSSRQEYVELEHIGQLPRWLAAL